MNCYVSFLVVHHRYNLDVVSGRQNKSLNKSGLGFNGIEK